MADTTDTRTTAQIRADIAARRARVSANLSNLVTEVHPTAVKERTINDAKSFAQTEFDAAKSTVKDDRGWRVDRLLMLGAAVVGTVALLVGVRAIVQAGRKA
ncbi:DUF3618 domain-containing protein [Aestuariimicrobium soli]|uniref:DUF3618 domain-containing protein n=1 Tax=Aestuariimicrobium soli TaxID=2035834 RepID=UPI003EB8154A